MHAAKLMRAYEGWCDGIAAFDEHARREKHERMAALRFAFLRAAYPVWVDRFAADPAADAETVPLGIGDLHVENFGTWLASAGEVFGVNDHDETGPVPYTNDLVRLVTSAILAAAEGRLELGPGDVARHVWSGYCDARDAAPGVVVG